MIKDSYRLLLVALTTEEAVALREKLIERKINIGLEIAGMETLSDYERGKLYGEIEFISWTISQIDTAKEEKKEIENIDMKKKVAKERVEAIYSENEILAQFTK